MKGTALVKAFLAEHQVEMPQIFNRSTNPKRVALRAKAIRHLDSSGLSTAEISRVLNIDPGTVRYWLDDDFRLGKTRTRFVNHRREKIYRWWDECAKVMEARA